MTLRVLLRKLAKIALVIIIIAAIFFGARYAWNWYKESRATAGSDQDIVEGGAQGAPTFDQAAALYCTDGVLTFPYAGQNYPCPNISGAEFEKLRE